MMEESEHTVCYFCDQAFQTEKELYYHGLDLHPKEADKFEAIFNKLVTKGMIVEISDEKIIES